MVQIRANDIVISDGNSYMAHVLVQTTAALNEFRAARAEVV